MTNKMEKITENHPLSGSQDILVENIQKLKEIFPEVFSEGRVDFEKLQLLLGDLITPNDELYGLNWWGKNEAIKESMKRSLGSLRPDKESSKNWDTTENIYIEGDNLEVLKLLQKSYNGKIKMIYIDPPYNTGKDFVYKDNYKDNLKNYLEQTGQVDSEGVKQSTNTKEDGRYHSNWLNMMYPRLKLARNLLNKDGVIFISIDDNEVQNLRNICDEIFGESNFLTSLVWRRRKTQANLANHIAPVHDFILIYARQVSSLEFFKIPFTEEFIKKSFSNPDNDLRGQYQTRPLAQPANSSNREYELRMPNGRLITAKWSCAQSTFDELVRDNRLVIPRDGDGMPRKKIFLSELDGILPNTWLDQIASNDDAAKEMEQLFGSNAFFSYPKPIRLIEYLMEMGLSKDGLILDFFAGSSTTANAVKTLNSKDRGHRKYIMVQVPENFDISSEPYKNGFKNLSELSIERIRRAGELILNEKKEVLDQLKGKISLIQTEDEKVKIQELEEIISKLDIGFKVFKLDSSNIEAWDSEMPDTVQGIQTRFEESRNHLKKGRREEDLLYELLLKQGLLLTSPIEVRTIAGSKVYSINHGELFICMNAPLTMNVVEGIGAWGKESIVEAIVDLKPILVLKDEAFVKDDAFRTNAELRLINEFGFAKVNTL